MKVRELQSKVWKLFLLILRPPQTRKHCSCGRKCFPVCACARNICCGRKVCVRDAKNVSEFFQNILRPQQMPVKCLLVCAARKQNICFASHSFARRGNITSNNVSAITFPRLRGPLFNLMLACLIFKLR